MPTYDFKNLSPVDFEELCRDLLQKYLGVFLESFKEGKDQGIDLRYTKDKKNTTIVQCKRYNSIVDLKKNLRFEFNKVKKINPQRYIIITSVDLTPKQKSEIKNIFKGISIKNQDILGKKDINNLLNQYPAIEQSHYKLWFNSTAILERIINSGIANRSEYEKEIIERELNIYVTNDSYKEAMTILDKYNYVIISGIPGIGKTTLARILIYNFLLSDFELVSISSDIDEAEKSYKPEVAQIFYYDDFLGTTFLTEYLSKNEDKRILKFIERIQKTNNKKLIFTTREYILNQAILKYELLKNNSIEIAKCMVDLQKYTKLVKGKILYNHLFFSNIDNSLLNDILENNRFLRIINHSNYNPRIIQYLTNRDVIGEKDCNNYFNFFIENLANPFRIWEYAYSSHISSISRYLLLILLSLGEPVFKDDLYFALLTFFGKNDKTIGIKVNTIEFNRCLKECENTFITIDNNGTGDKIIHFQNPSIRDYLVHYLNSNSEITSYIINGLSFFNQYFEIFTPYPFLHKVYLNNEIRKEISKSMCVNWYTLPVSKLGYYYDNKIDGVVRAKDTLNKIERLEKISDFFDLADNSEVLELLRNEINTLISSQGIKNYKNINNYINLIKNLDEHIELDKQKILDSIFSEEVISSFDDIKESVKIKEIFPDEYDEFKYEKKDNLDNLIESIVSEEYQNISPFPKKDKMNEFQDELKFIEKEFDTDISEYHDLINDILDDIEDIKDDGVKELKKIIPINSESDNDDEVLINIFSSLFHKG